MMHVLVWKQLIECPPLPPPLPPPHGFPSVNLECGGEGVDVPPVTRQWQTRVEYRRCLYYLHRKER